MGIGSMLSLATVAFCDILYCFVVALGYLTFCQITRVYVFDYGMYSADFTGTERIYWRRVRRGDAAQISAKERRVSRKDRDADRSCTSPAGGGRKVADANLWDAFSAEARLRTGGRVPRVKRRAFIGRRT
ncbi:hypothetical protein Z043_123817 [Scleropages formosus]|uniref:Uncharacterized protein n=1 Tax=Scleropages formosus TaxID=113540 RepID=A0A0P7WB95_SCLFO|nr:hypothetical protein Z043_123817 [Scleropages formosus]